MQSIGDGPPENAEGLGMQCVQSTGGHIDRHFTGQEQVLVKNELQLLVSLVATLDHAGTGVELESATGLQVQLCLHSAAATLDLGNFFVCQRS